MLRWISGLLVVGASWAAEPSDREDHGHEDHGHEDHEHEEEPGVDGDAQEPTGCEELPPKAMQALEAHYEAQQQWEARQQTYFCRRGCSLEPAERNRRDSLRRPQLHHWPPTACHKACACANTRCVTWCRRAF